MENRTIDRESKRTKELTITPVGEWEFMGNKITGIQLRIMRGSGMGYGASCISIKLIQESGGHMDVGGYAIIDDKLARIGGPVIEESDTPGGKLARSFNAYFAEYPDELEQMKQELEIV